MDRLFPALADVVVLHNHFEHDVNINYGKRHSINKTESDIIDRTADVKNGYRTGRPGLGT
jgi:hypothetical protein